MKSLVKKIIIHIYYWLLTPFILIAIIFVKKKHTDVIWGPIPMINYKYWSQAIKKSGYNSKTLVNTIKDYEIYEESDFDLYYKDMVPEYLQINDTFVQKIFGPLCAFIYIVKFAKIINISFLGGPLWNTPISFLESYFYKLAGIKVVVSGFGGDFYMYSKIINPSVRHVLLMSYPKMAIKEENISKRVLYWTKHADCIVNGFQIDGLGRWDALPVNMISIGNDKIVKRKEHKKSEMVTIVHTPNHRGFKGTEFIVQAVEELKQEGYKINFLLLENTKNTEVLKILREEADILVEQLIIGYALSAIEGMASGIPVLSNLSNEEYTQLLRRYSYLDECPILSTTPETVKENIRLLIENPDLRKELGELGIRYVNKYHSEESAQYMYGKIFNQLLTGKNEDLINMFHPLKSEYNKRNYIKTPLKNNLYVQ